MASRKTSERIADLLRNARQVKDPLSELITVVKSCDVNGRLRQVRAYHARDMPKDLHEWCFELCRDNMAAMYHMAAARDSDWKWSDAKKRKQLTATASRFLVVHDVTTSRTPLAVLNYRFEKEEGEPVLYCYELQVHRTAQGQGLGRLLMELVEQIAWATSMSKVMLTVFADNTSAVGFYRKLGYGLDETSPDYPESGEADLLAQESAEREGSGPGGTAYHIMSKRAPAPRPASSGSGAGDVALVSPAQQVDLLHPTKRPRTGTVVAHDLQGESTGVVVPGEVPGDG